LSLSRANPTEILKDERKRRRPESVDLTSEEEFSDDEIVDEKARKNKKARKLPDEEVFGAAEKILFGRDKRSVVGKFLKGSG